MKPKPDNTIQEVIMFELKRQVYAMDFKIYRKSEEASAIICLGQSFEEERENESTEKPNALLWKELLCARSNI
jgi:hypothetical protein